jgi:hypothetical protein
MTALPPDELSTPADPCQSAAMEEERRRFEVGLGFEVKNKEEYKEDYSSADAEDFSRRGACMVALPMEGGLSQQEAEG